MYNVSFQKGSNIPVLSANEDNDVELSSLRPVFFEELDNLGFREHWDYSKSKAPLLWASGRRYYYKGQLVAETAGGDIFNAPKITYYYKGKINPVNIKGLICTNKGKLEVLENEAKMFISKTYLQYRDKSVFTISYSGGKDSQAILELALQVIPPEDLTIVYNDTGMEMPYVEENIRKLQNRIKENKTPISILITKPKAEIEQLWKEFGPPTRQHRWCCTVCKTAPFVNAYNNLNGGNKQIMNIAGIRAEESNSRKGYARINTKGKHSSVTNVHPILYWSSFEVFLYLIYLNAEINRGYRHGLLRVGCSVCPYSNPLSEYINHKLYPEKTWPLLMIIEKSLKKADIPNGEINEYIRNKDWARNVRLPSLIDFEKKYILQEIKESILITTNLSEHDLYYGMCIFKNFHSRRDDDATYIEFVYDDIVVNGSIDKNKDSLKITIKNMAGNRSFINIIKRILNKLCYCVSCSACDLLCPTKALSTEKRTVDLTLCTHCMKCVLEYENGCLNANYRINLRGEGKVNELGTLNRYWGFGIRQEWLDQFINDTDAWVSDNNLGEFQFKAMKNWLVDGGLLEKNLESSSLFKLLKKRCTNEQLTMILWLNLINGSTVCNWYSTLEQRSYTRNELDSLLEESFSNTKRIRNNAMLSLLGTLKQTHLSEYYDIFGFEMKGASIITIQKQKIKNIDGAILTYALYKYYEKTGLHATTLNHIASINQGTNTISELGLSDEELKKMLLSLQEHRSKVVRVEFHANLDNIFLNKELNAEQALQAYLEV